MAKELRLTTKDNPFDPFDEVDRWRNFDEQFGYYTDSLLARLCVTSSEESEQKQKEAYEQAIHDVMTYCDFGIYEVVEREVSE